MLKLKVKSFAWEDFVYWLTFANQLALVCWIEILCNPWLVCLSIWCFLFSLEGAVPDDQVVNINILTASDNNGILLGVLIPLLVALLLAKFAGCLRYAGDEGWGGGFSVRWCTAEDPTTFILSLLDAHEQSLALIDRYLLEVVLPVTRLLTLDLGLVHDEFGGVDTRQHMNCLVFFCSDWDGRSLCWVEPGCLMDELLQVSTTHLVIYLWVRGSRRVRSLDGFGAQATTLSESRLCDLHVFVADAVADFE